VSRVLFSGEGGRIVVPDLLLVDRKDGGHLCVDPPRDVWERGELSAEELAQWSYLVAAAGSAMIEALPQLEGGCVNYWEAGNWSLHHDATPQGPKTAPASRRVHLHLLGRSRFAADPDWAWGEAPRFPSFADRLAWSARFEPLNEDECADIVARARRILADRYGVTDSGSSGVSNW
jgi:diadenosine tetraphosphate (Ap4A) HIT family hydrolase